MVARRVAAGAFGCGLVGRPWSCRARIHVDLGDRVRVADQRRARFLAGYIDGHAVCLGEVLPEDKDKEHAHTTTKNEDMFSRRGRELKVRALANLMVPVCPAS